MVKLKLKGDQMSSSLLVTFARIKQCYFRSNSVVELIITLLKP